VKSNDQICKKEKKNKTIKEKTKCIDQMY